MLNLKRLSSAIATGAVLVSVMAPGAFANSIDISGNGAFSENRANVSQSNRTTLNQSNDSRVTNDVSVNNNTGRNTSSFNTGGDSSIVTGDATSRVNISNEGGTNIASIPNCGCDEGGSIWIKGNGAFSENKVDVRSRNDVSLNQKNRSDFNNRVDVRNNTGDNRSSYNTSGSLWDWWDKHFSGNSHGNNFISTGDARSDVSIWNGGSTNILH